MKRIKVPDYKDRSVFGVPLTVNVQRTGQPLPQSIQQAMRYLQNHYLDQVRVLPVGPRTQGSLDYMQLLLVAWCEHCIHVNVPHT